MSGKSILIVDDELHVRNAMRLSLVTRGYEVEVAGTVKEGRKKIDQSQPALIVLDYMLQGETGLDLVASNNSMNRPIPVILVSAEADGAALWKSLKAGIVDMLSKPLEPNHLRQRVRAVLNRKYGKSPETEPKWVALLKEAALEMQGMNPKQALELLASIQGPEDRRKGLELLKGMAAQLAKVEDYGNYFKAIGWPSTWHLSSSLQFFQDYCSLTEDLLNG